MSLFRSWFSIRQAPDGCRTSITSGLAAIAWTTTPTQGSRIRDVPSADSGPVYRPYVEKTCSAAAPFRCGRFYGSLHPNALISVPSQGVASIRAPYLKRFVGVDTRAIRLRKAYG